MSSLGTRDKGSENVYRAMMERAAEILVVVQQGRFRYANPATSAVLGYCAEELYQMSFLDIVAPEARETATELCTPPMDDLSAPSYEIEAVKKDGRPVRLELTASRLTYEGAPAVQLRGRDISEQKRQWEHLVQSEKMAALRRFISAVAHELNNPLTVIAGFAEILQSNLKLNDQDQADLQMVVSEAARARRMIHELLGLSRPQPQQKQPMDLNQLIASTLDHHRADLQASRIEVITDLAADVPEISADPSQLQEVLTHLIKYIRKSLTTGRDGGRLRVGTAVKQVKSRAGWRHIAQITVADNGPSRPQDDLRQIFEPAYSTREEDHGLGLALVYNLIQQHGGQILALSGSDGGLRFVIELPVE
ncbi:MAG: PAS domain S-box protein [Acidobacteria bacterium]|nr:PAS domain S-box protein [Acidobacteriota bacterium]